MFRTRLIPLALAASLGLISGCSFSTSWGVGVPRLRGGGGSPCSPCNGGAEGIPIDDFGGGVGSSPVVGTPVSEGPHLPQIEGGGPPGTCTNGNLPVAPMPKLVNPEISQPVPYAPSSAKGAKGPR